MIKNDVLLFLHIWHKSDVIIFSFSFIFFLLKLQPFSPIKSPVRQGGPSSPILFCQAAVLSYSSKLFWQLATLENCKEGKYDRNLLKGAENMQQWQKNWQNVEECGCTWDHLFLPFEALQFISFRVPILFFKPNLVIQGRLDIFYPQLVVLVRWGFEELEAACPSSTISQSRPAGGQRHLLPESKSTKPL